MPTFRHGKSASILFNEFDMSSYLNDASNSTSIETAETTAFGASAKSYIVGLTDATTSLSGMFEGLAGGTDAVFSSVVGSSTTNVLTVFPEGVSATGNRASLTAGRLTSYETTSPVGDVVSCSIEVQATGGRAFGVMLAGSSISATANGSSVDNAALTSNGGVGHIHVPTNTRNGTVVVKVQHSVDNSTWVDLITFATVAISTATSERVEVTGTVNRYIRAIYTVNGATGAATVYVAFARR